MSPIATVLREPSLAAVGSYADALRRGWSPNTMRPEASGEQLQKIQHDAAAFVASLTDPQAQAGPVTLPDGSQVPRLPSRQLWVWDPLDDSFCGCVNLRWQNGTAALPAYVLGHVGYTIVTWRRRRGHATAALRALLPIARAQGLPHLDLTTDEDNWPSQRVIETNGGVLSERFTPPPAFGDKMLRRYRIVLA